MVVYLACFVVCLLLVLFWLFAVSFCWFLYFFCCNLFDLICLLVLWFVVGCWRVGFVVLFLFCGIVLYLVYYG